jgi:hypothetical protein
LKHDTREAADWVRVKGNDAVHKKPNEDDARKAVEITVKVMDALAEGKH